MTGVQTCALPISWSLGNFLSNQNKRYTDAGVILSLHLKKNFDQHKSYFGNVEYLPTWVYRGERSAKKMHIVFPAEWSVNNKHLPDYLDNELMNKMKQSFEDTDEIINRYGPSVKLKAIK
mgnify:FL=1